MAVRSIKLKMILPRGEDGRRLRESLWLTHSAVNQALAKIEEVLLLCRGREYSTTEGIVPAGKVAEAAITLARKVQTANGRPGVATDEEILAALRQLYEAIVPSVVLDSEGKPLSATAQAAGAFVGPLMDPRSRGFLSVFEKVLDPLPAWVGKMQANSEGWVGESVQWLSSEEAQRLQYASGGVPAWVRRLRASDPWQDAFLRDQDKKRRETRAVPSLIRRLKRDLGLLPLVQPPIASVLAGKESGLTPWDRLAFALAAGHLLSWESWNHRAAAEYRRVAEHLERQRASLVPLAPSVRELRRYEAERHEELKRTGLADDARPFRIGVRAVRAWDQVRQLWRGTAGMSEASRTKSLAELRARLFGRFGDSDLFRWLGAEGREHLWKNDNPLPALVGCNALERLLDKKKNGAIYTPPDPILHPQWLGYEALGGHNLRTYAIGIEDGTLALGLPLLVEDGESLAENKFTIRLAPSGQLESPRLEDQKCDTGRLLFRSSHQDYAAELRGAAILFDRRHLENRSLDELQEGKVGRVWFKLVLGVDSQAPPDWLDSRGRLTFPAVVRHFQSGLATKSMHADALAPGLRVLSVHLGVRTFASCSVFELVQGRPTTGMVFSADKDRDLWARHERSFLLPLPGEMPHRRVLAARRAVHAELRALRRGMDCLRGILRLSVKETPEDRRAALEDLDAALKKERVHSCGAGLDLLAIDRLKELIACPPAEWQTEVTKQHREAERILGEYLARWRKETRRRTDGAAHRQQRRGYQGGKSDWAIDYLEAVRRLLIGWTLRGRAYGAINRQDRQKRGTFAARLLEHVRKLKEDRVKAGCDLIVQAARGHVPDERRGWQHRHEACRLILFEDLSQYRVRADRPRRENSQLMRWCHRRILAETKMHAEIYGILVTTTGAAFSSRFHARTAAAGCRTHVLCAEEVKSEGFQRQLQALAEECEVDAQQLRPGARIPWESGEDLTTVAKDGSAVVIQVDLNAAQNLQRRFWTRHGDAYRLSAIPVRQENRDYWYPDGEGVRLRGALASLVGGEGYGRLTLAEDGDGYVLEAVTKASWKKVMGGGQPVDEEAGLDELAFELTEVTETDDFERDQQKQVFFRDPSGLVLRADRWYDGKVFWERLRRKIVQALGLNPRTD